jgi:hypothetical protein
VKASGFSWFFGSAAEAAACGWLSPAVSLVFQPPESKEQKFFIGILKLPPFIGSDIIGTAI